MRDCDYCQGYDRNEDRAYLFDEKEVRDEARGLYQLCPYYEQRAVSMLVCIARCKAPKKYSKLKTKFQHPCLAKRAQFI